MSLVTRLLSRSWDDRQHRLLRDEAARRITNLEAALRRINSINDNPARFSAEIQAVLDSVIDTSDTKFGNAQQ